MRTNRLMRTVMGIGSFIVAGWSEAAWAQAPCAERARVDALEEEGQSLRRAHRDAEALQRFEQAWSICREPRAMVRRGLAEWAMGRWVEAEAHVVEGLARRDAPWVQANHEAIEREDLAAIRSHLGSLELVGGGGSGEVRIGGQRVADWPTRAPIRVVRGESVVEVVVPGFHPWRRTVNVPTSGLAREQVDLVPNSQPAPASSVVSARPPGLGGAQRHVTNPEATATPTLRALAWVGTALTLAAGGTALGTFIAHNDASSEFDRSECASPISAEVQSQCYGIADRRDTMGTIAAVTGIAAGVFAVGTAVMWVQSARGGSRERSTARLMGCSPMTGAPGVHCALSF